jgi:hypothetical protein
MLKREKIEELIDNLNDWEVIEIAYHNWIPGMADGITAIDVRDGKVFGYSSMTGEYSMDERYYVFLYRIYKNTELDYNDLLTDEELEELEESERDFDEFIENKNIDITERELDTLEYYYWEERKEREEKINKQLDEIYNQI